MYISARGVRRETQEVLRGVYATRISLHHIWSLATHRITTLTSKYERRSIAIIPMSLAVK